MLFTFQNGQKTVVSYIIYIVAEYCTGLQYTYCKLYCTVLSIFVCNSALSMLWRIGPEQNIPEHSYWDKLSPGFWDPRTKHPWPMFPDPEPQRGGMIIIAICFNWFKDTLSHHFIYLTVTVHTGLYKLHCTVLYCAVLLYKYIQSYTQSTSTE